MASLVGIVTKTTKSFLDVNTISVDNWTFKCFYKVKMFTRAVILAVLLLGDE